MPARTGQQYLEAINRQRREVWIDGERITENVAEHPAFRGVTRTLAELYDMQHDPEYRDELTYVCPETGERVGMSFLQPRTREDLARRSRMFYLWHSRTCGMMGRSADYLNSAIMAMAAAADYFGQADRKFAENIRSYYKYVRDNDLLLTHTLINPQVNRAVGPSQQVADDIAARIVDEDDYGITIRGARLLATLGPITDEIMVFPSTLLKSGPEDEPYAYAFAIPCDTPGLRFICRETFDYGRSHQDHPLGSRFEEMDAIVVFDNVRVPWERVFMYRQPELCNGLYAETGAVVHMTHQVVTKNVAKSEFLLGLVSFMTEAIGIEGFQHVQEKVAEFIIALEFLKAALRASEADAQIDRWGLMRPEFSYLNAARNWYPRTYPRLVDLIHQLGASGLMAIPSMSDFEGPIRPDLEKYLQGRGVDANTRVRLFRLAWDVAGSAFGQRQALYERFFFGDPVRMAGALVRSYDRKHLVERVRQFLEAPATVRV
ncbi:MAG: 4-hydroxyphenylacetate 3-monooxygenase, oxygenase component [Thermaerobacter sp.]|nr:4-hydroxyphenylacetate 3-monooxygenase, oxygenase component [Bacillota bacterium]REJ33673.1 MAG: 4-hydroxyphenylacetate 3-monooxygenase, oxygenase component [Bacillota bacterium]